jgi:hypothetical protein
MLQFWPCFAVNTSLTLPWRVCQLILLILVPTNPSTDSTWCHSIVTSSQVPSSECDVPWLHIVHQLLPCPACVPGHRPASHFCVDTLLPTSEWPHYHNHLDVLLANLRIHPSCLASFCAPSTLPHVDSACLLIFLFGNPPLGIPAATRNCCWLDIIEAMPVSYVVCALLLPPLLPRLSPVHAGAATGSLDSAISTDSLDCSQASLLSVLWLAPLKPQSCCPNPIVSVAVPRCLVFLVFWPRSDMTRSPVLPVPSPWRCSAHVVAASLADSYDEVPILHIPHGSPLISCDGDDEVLISLPMLACSSSTPRPFLRPRPAELVAGTDALFGMAMIHVLFLLLPIFYSRNRVGMDLQIQAPTAWIGGMDLAPCLRSWMGSSGLGALQLHSQEQHGRSRS